MTKEIDWTSPVVGKLENMQRFKARLKTPENNDVCWFMYGCVDPNGYSRMKMRIGSKLEHMSYRVSYLLFRGAIPKGLCLDHLCRNRWCVNPYHLEIVTRGQNVLRGEGITARNARKTHCINGHEYNEANTYWHRNKRHCRVCSAQNAKRIYYKARNVSSVEIREIV